MISPVFSKYIHRTYRQETPATQIPHNAISSSAGLVDCYILYSVKRFEFQRSTAQVRRRKRYLKKKKTRSADDVTVLTKDLQDLT